MVAANRRPGFDNGDPHLGAQCRQSQGYKSIGKSTAGQNDVEFHDSFIGNQSPVRKPAMLIINIAR